MTNQLFTTQENHCPLTISKPALRKTVGYSMSTMGAYDKAEICELVGNYLLYELLKLYEKKNIRLYRDHRLAVFKNKSRAELEKIRKPIQAIFRENELKITIQHNLKTVDYLGVIFTLQIPLLVDSIKQIMK